MANDRNPNIQSPQDQMPMRNTGVSKIGPIAEGLAAVTEVGVGMRQQQLNTQLADDLVAEQEKTLKELEISSQELTGEAMPPGDAKTLQEFQSHMDDLKAASEAGSRSITDLKIRQERILRDYMARYPQLAGQFNKSATGVLGYSPLGAAVRAAEAASRGGGSGGVGAITSFYMQRANELGVDTTLYLTQPEKFWSELQRRSSRRALIEDATQWRGMWQTLDSTKLDSYVAAIAAEFWDAEGGVNAMIDAALQQVGYAGGQAALTEAVAQGREIGATVETLLGTGVYERYKATIRQMRDQAAQQLYAQFVEQNSQVFNGQRVAPLTFTEFTERVQPILDLYDYAAEFAGNEYALKAVEDFNKAREQGALSALPGFLVRVGAVNNLMGGNETLTQMFLKGQVSEEVQIEVNRFLGLLGPSPRGTSTAPTGQPIPSPVFDPLGNRVDRPPNQGVRFRTPAELKANAPEALEALDESYQQLLTDVAGNWLQVALDEGDADVAAIVVAAAQAYTGMVEQAKRPNVPYNYRPSTETDDAYLAIVGHPNFKDIWELAYPDAGNMAQYAVGQDAWNLAHERVTDVVAGEIARVTNIIRSPDTVLAGYGAYNPSNIGSWGPGAVPGRNQPTTPKRDPDFVNTMFANNYLAFEVDKENMTIAYKLRDTTPQAFREYGQFIVDVLNDGSRADKRRLAQYAIAGENIRGREAGQALSDLILTVAGR